MLEKALSAVALDGPMPVEVEAVTGHSNEAWRPSFGPFAAKASARGRHWMDLHCLLKKTRP